MTPLLKGRFKPERRGGNWPLSIREKRREVSDALADNPSLHARIWELLAAQRETERPEETFPAECPWTFDQAMQDGMLQTGP